MHRSPAGAGRGTALRPYAMRDRLSEATPQKGARFDTIPSASASLDDRESAIGLLFARERGKRNEMKGRDAMRPRAILFLGSMFCLCIATISLLPRGVASASAPRQTAAGCATIDSYQVSAPRGRIPMPRWAQQCQPALDSVAGGAASEAAVRSAGALPGTQSIVGYPTVGKFFFKVAGISLNCTATVIGDARNNPKRALIRTAAHCIEGVLSGFRYMTGDWMFAPMWHDNKFPYGKWAVKSVYIEGYSGAPIS
jgi:hypothetical protein